MEQMNKYRSPIVLGVLVLFLLLFAFFLLGFKPTNDKISEQESEMSQLEQQNSLMETKIEELNSSSANDDAQEELLAQLPRGDNSEQLILDLRNIGALTDARLKEIGFTLEDTNPIQEMTGSASVVYPTVKELKLTATVEGTYTSLRNWLTALQLLPRIINVEAYSFQHSNDSGNILSASVTFTAYYEQSADTASLEQR
ncbi:type 4a pilus biogenesis protein PilO [Paenibacillus sp. MMS20-IR301]|uniref:type 4a pilus biogenesis protein PilO n=1 Tax=Paenibacillus sp. MMS20-IR301 TaxID=2895946 RepID=UPI0028E643D2|nr:type 4a pilus biogenesis protein PilO [Paenibacillus sp. MMS20-IR301]WNS42696.1 type 4a pilus biogenesis protein PilO [Paenibacillus sp. MMS20-IR301]